MADMDQPPDLGLDLFRTVGRARIDVAAATARELTKEDILALGEEKGSQPPPIQRLTDRHHNLARTLAEGVPHGEAGILCGYSSSRVSILLSDPAFKELVEFYRQGITDRFFDMHDRLHSFSKDALDELHVRLEEDPGKFSIGQLMESTKLGADRTGYGPQSSSTNVNVNVDLAGRLEAARKRLANRQLTIENGSDEREDQ